MTEVWEHCLGVIWTFFLLSGICILVLRAYKNWVLKSDDAIKYYVTLIVALIKRMDNSKCW